MIAEIISVGTELLLGKVVNTDTTIVAQALSGIGVDLLYAATVGDNPARLKKAVEDALERSDLLITTGGLGPTGDDLTKETVAAAAGRKLVFHQESYDRLVAQFPGREMSKNMEKQVWLPEGCDVLLNDNGTAPGCVFTTDKGKMVMMFPGPPSELVPMLNNYAIPYLLKGDEAIIVSHNIHIYGKGEAPVAMQIADLMESANPTVAPYAKEGECFVRVTAKASSEEEADEMCRPIIEEIKNRVGDFVYSVDVESLEELVVKELMEQGKTLATAESCTGGYLAKRITDISGSSSVFETGCVTYANATKEKLLGVKHETLEKYGAVSEQTAREMAEGIVKLSGADIGIGITGIAGPGGGSEEKPVGLIYLALSDGENTWVTARRPFGRRKNREWHRFVAASHALDMVRRYLEGLPVIGEDSL
ncbi:MAG: competence/damage-inducible protein A [Clostridia bacterium]|nr:competence/damage-inducible protein A [Clostridia bacterium]